jgi:hypothetical protein
VSVLRERLTAQLQAKVQRHGVVIWSDPQGVYREVAADVAPAEVDFEPFDGSWYELRRRVEPVLAASEPRAVIYLDVDAPNDDPLEELRQTGTRFAQRLETLLNQCLSDEYTSAKLKEVAQAAGSLPEAETLLSSGAGGGPARLIKEYGTSEPTELVLRILDAETAPSRNDTTHRDAVVEFLQSHFGVQVSPTSGIPAAIARHLVLAELRKVTGHLPDNLAVAVANVRADARDRSVDLLARWRRDTERRPRLRELMQAVNDDLALASELAWTELLGELDTVPAYEELAFAEYLGRYAADRFVEAEDLAARRLSGSIWVEHPDPTSGWRERWSVAHLAAQLQRLVASTRPSDGSIDELLETYRDQDWQIDRCHRELEIALLSLVDTAELEEPIRRARRGYEEWVDALLRRFTTVLSETGLETELLPQGQVHARVVGPRAEHGAVAYLMVDALRYELGQELAAALRQQFPDGQLGIDAAVTLLPSITTVGMANLCPGADDGLELRLQESGKLAVTIDGQPVMSPPHRLSRLQAAHGRIADLTLDDIFRLTERELTDQLDGARVVLVRSQEIDQAGESGKIAIGPQAFEQVIGQLSRSVARLAHRGVTNFVISADHGFLAVTREIGSHMIIPNPGGAGELHRRAFVGHGGAAGDALARVALEKLGLASDLDVLVPRGLALIAAGGARGFFHGGASPQEMLVPVITLEVQPPEGSVQVAVTASLTPKVTSQVVLAKIELQQDLLSEPLSVRLALERSKGGGEVGVVATTDAEEHEGLIRLEPGRLTSVGFRLTSSLARGEKVELHVYDARTDRRLATSKAATAARALEVDDELA